MIKLLGICMLLFTFIILAAEYSERRRATVAVCEEMLSFLSCVGRQLSCFLCPIKSTAAQFVAETAAMRTFLERVAEGEEPAAAYSAAGISAVVPKSANRVLTSFFAEFGKGYAEGELRRIDSAVAELSALVETERIEAPRKIRLFKTLGCAVSFGIIILLI